MRVSEHTITSAIIVSWNTRDLTLDCIGSFLARNRQTQAEVIVVDNASTDGTPEAVRRRFPSVRILANRENMGFARAVNLGLAAAHGDPLLIMNADTLLLSDEPIARIRSFLSARPRAGIVGATLLFPDGRVQSCGRRFQSLQTLIKMHLLFADAPLFATDHPRLALQPRRVDYVDGAFMAIRRKVVDEIGPMDERHFLYAEDMEWCWRAHKAGWEVVVLPDIKVRHLQGSGARHDLVRALCHNAVNVSHMVGIMQGWRHARWAWRVILMGMLLRVPLAVLRRSGQSADYWRALRRCLSLSPNLRTVLKEQWPDALLASEKRWQAMHSEAS